MKMTRPIAMIAIAALVVLGCDDDPQEVVDPCTLTPCSDAALVEDLRDAYATMDADRFAALLHPDFQFEGQGGPLSTAPNSWRVADETLLHQRMFDPGQFAGGEHPVPSELRLEGIQIELTPVRAFEELPQYYESPTNPAGFDSTLFAVTGAEYNYLVLAQTAGETDYQLDDVSYFVVVRDRSKATNESGAFTLYRWHDLDRLDVSARRQDANWTGFKQMYREPTVDSCFEIPCSVEAVVMHLTQAYQQRDHEEFAALLHPDFLFFPVPDPLNPGQPEFWDDTEEARIHHRMFEPQAFTKDPNPVPEELWLTAITIQQTTSRAFVERPEYYASVSNPDGLDPQRYKAWGTDYNDSVLFQTQGETDYQVTGESYYVIVEDLTKSPGERGAFLLYRWQDLGAGSSSRSESQNWSQIKSLYK